MTQKKEKKEKHEHSTYSRSIYQF